METLTLLVILISIALPCIQGVEHPNVAAHSFCYDDPTCGPSTWPGICGYGKRQSPIDITVKTADVNFKYAQFEMNDHYLQERMHHFFGQNNGHTAQFELNRNTSNLHSNLSLCGGGLTSCYRFAQFHFHWDKVDSDGSEHTINGKRFPMELHLVHYKEKYTSLADALSSEEKDAVAVMAVLFQISELDNPRLDSIVLALQSLRTPAKVLDFYLPLKVSNLYPKHKDFARYFGSLTTPTCDEKVVWTVFLSTFPISENQMKKFRQVRNDEGVSDFNFRPTQSLNGRQIAFYKAADFILSEATNT